MFYSLLECDIYINAFVISFLICWILLALYYCFYCESYTIDPVTNNDSICYFMSYGNMIAIDVLSFIPWMSTIVSSSKTLYCEIHYHNGIYNVCNMTIPNVNTEIEAVWEKLQWTVTNHCDIDDAFTKFLQGINDIIDLTDTTNMGYIVGEMRRRNFTPTIYAVARTPPSNTQAWLTTTGPDGNLITKEKRKYQTWWIMRPSPDGYQEFLHLLTQNSGNYHDWKDDKTSLLSYQNKTIMGQLYKRNNDKLSQSGNFLQLFDPATDYVVNDNVM